MNTLKLKSFSFFILLMTATGCRTKECKYPQFTRISSIEMKGPAGTSYLHEVLALHLDRECLDSNQIMKKAYEYIKYGIVDTPISVIEVYNTKINYDSGETLSQSKSFYRNRLLTLTFDKRGSNLEEVSFYNSNGDIVYTGEEWYHKR